MKRGYDESEELTALVMEAKRRGLTYGKLVGATSAYERDEIIRKYRRGEERVKKQKKEKAR